MPKMVETEDLVQLRRLSLELLRQLWAGQEAMRQAVAEAASESSLDSSSSHDVETPLSQETTSTVLRASSLPGTPQDGPCDLAWPGGTSSLAVSLPAPSCQHQKCLSRPRPHSAPLLVTSDLNNPELSAELGNPGHQQAVKCILTPRQSKPSKPRVTFRKEPAMPEWSWRLRPYLGYDWIAGSLDSTSPVTGKSEVFFSKLQKFRETNKEECIFSDPESQFLSLCESSNVDEDHECVYCYRVNRRLFLVPADPGTPCRLCRTPRDQHGPETLEEPAQVRVSIPVSVLDPPHRYRIHRRKSFDASDTLALPRHCLLGWDIIPPKPEKSSAPRNLDLWSCVSSEAQHRKLSAASPTRLGLFPPGLYPSTPQGSTDSCRLPRPPTLTPGRHYQRRLRPPPQSG